jgi:hypothetical protein
MFEMQLDDNYLPATIDVNRNLHSRIDSWQFSDAALTAYHMAVWRHDAPAIIRKDYAATYPYPTRRAQLMAQLDAGSLQELENLERAGRGDLIFEASGPVTDFGRPSVTVTANIAYVVSIAIDPQWAARVQPFAIGVDIIECAASIREQRPIYSETGSWAHRTDEELEGELREYLAYLRRG